MAKIDDATFKGKRGSYSFEVYPTDTSFNAVGAVYIFTKRKVGSNGKGTHTLLCIGQTDSLKDRITRSGLVQIETASPSVQTHLGILQGVIERMASNSMSSKAWCIALVSAVLVIVADKEKPDLALLALIPTVLFLALGAYYLALEKGFRNSYKCFVRKVHDGTLTPEDLYSVIPKGRAFVLQLEALRSFSVWGFYGALVLLILVARAIVLP
jgi:hypothetical protein